MADDDAYEDLEKAKKEAAKHNVRGVLCDKGMAIEDMLFAHLPWDSIAFMLQYAADHHKNVFPILEYQDLASIDAITDVAEQERVRDACAKKSKDSKDGGWYKCIDHGEFVGKLWIASIDNIDSECGLKKEFDEMIDWIGDDID